MKFNKHLESWLLNLINKSHKTLIIISLIVAFVVYYGAYLNYSKDLISELDQLFDDYTKLESSLNEAKLINDLFMASSTRYKDNNYDLLNITDNIYAYKLVAISKIDDAPHDVRNMRKVLSMINDKDVIQEITNSEANDILNFSKIEAPNLLLVGNKNNIVLNYIFKGKETNEFISYLAKYLNNIIDSN